jgi:hypothetical protein
MTKGTLLMVATEHIEVVMRCDAKTVRVFRSEQAVNTFKRLHRKKCEICCGKFDGTRTFTDFKQVDPKGSAQQDSITLSVVR